MATRDVAVGNYSRRHKRGKPTPGEDRPSRYDRWTHHVLGDSGQKRKPDFLPVPAAISAKRRTDLTSDRAARPALVEATQEPAQSVSRPGELAAQSSGNVRRLASGRTVPNLVRAMECRLFSACAVEDEQGNMTPSPGLFAECEGRLVMILKCFTRYRVLMAHVIPVETDRSGPLSHVAYLRRVFTCRQAGLSDIGLHFVSAKKFCSKGKRAFRFQRSPDAMAGAPEFVERARMQVACARYASVAAPMASLEDVGARPTVEPIRIVPAALEAHLRFQESSGRPHCAGPRTDVQTVGFVLDLPRPVPFDARGHRCSTCRHDPSCAAARDMTYHLTDGDIQRMFLGVLVYTRGARSAVYMTKRFLVHLVLSFYDVLNARATRRKLCELYAANSLFAESALAWSVTALPRCRVLRDILCKALGSFLAGAVRRMRRRIHVYSGQVIRGDGNHDLA